MWWMNGLECFLAWFKAHQQLSIFSEYDINACAHDCLLWGREERVGKGSSWRRRAGLFFQTPFFVLNFIKFHPSFKNLIYFIVVECSWFSYSFYLSTDPWLPHGRLPSSVTAGNKSEQLHEAYLRQYSMSVWQPDVCNILSHKIKGEKDGVRRGVCTALWETDLSVTAKLQTAPPSCEEPVKLSAHLFS